MKMEPRAQTASDDASLMISPMIDADIKEVLRIEQQSFSTTWPSNAFFQELHDNKLAHYYVGRVGHRVVAYGGIWVILEDSHVTTIAVSPEFRGRKYGEQVLLHLLDQAIDRGASWMTLEVRESNNVAQALYRKYGFTTVSTRKAYYSDNNENALVMWAGNLKSEIYKNRLRALRLSLFG